MEYLIVLALQFIGIGFNVMKEIIKIDNEYPEKKFKEVWNVFFTEDLNTLLVSFLGLCLDLLIHFIMVYYNAPCLKWQWFIFVSFAVSLLVGYGGQEMIYKYLGTARNVLDKKIADKIS